MHVASDATIYAVAIEINAKGESQYQILLVTAKQNWMQNGKHTIVTCGEY